MKSLQLFLSARGIDAQREKPARCAPEDKATPFDERGDFKYYDLTGCAAVQAGRAISHPF